MTMTLVQPRTVTLGSLGLGGVDEDGVQWGLTDLSGWDSPSSTIGWQQKPRAAGSWLVVPPYLRSRSISATGFVRAPTAALATAAEDRLIAAVTLDLTRLTVTEPGRGERWAMVARDGQVLTQWVSDGAFKWSWQVSAPDPRKYGEPITLSTGLPSSTGGLTWPVAWPIEWDGVTVSGVLHIDNPGNIPSPIVARIDGPAQGPLIRHVSSGIELVLSSSYELAAGNWLDIDMERRQVLENGQASRNGWIVDRGWFALDPGSNDLIFGAQASNPDALLTVTTYPAYQ